MGGSPTERGTWAAWQRTWAAYGRDVGPRVARRSRASLSQRVHRLGSRAFFISQCAVSAGVAWAIAALVLGHTQPFFAPVAALVALGQSYGQRLERVVSIVLGVAIGVFVGDVFIHLFGSGYWQLGIIIAVSMAIATLLDAGVLTTTQAGVQSAFVTMIVAPPGEAFSRWSDALVGGLVALAAATITPASPIRRPRQHAATIVAEIGAVLHETARAVRGRDLRRAEAALARARHSETALATLEGLAADGLSVVRYSPFRRGHLPAVQAIADLLMPLDRAIRNIRVLVRRACVALREGEAVPKAYVDMVDDLAAVAYEMAADLHRRHLPEGARPALYELAERTTYVDPHPVLSSEVIRAQIRSTVVDLLMVTGLTHAQALDCIPVSYELGEEMEDDDGP